MNTYSQRKTFAREGARQLNAIVDAALADQAAHEADVKALRAARRQAEMDRVKFTADDLSGAVVVRDRSGWHRVVRVSKTSVTVATAYSWDDRIPMDRILEYRK